MWRLVDIRAEPDGDTPDTHYCTTGCWPHGDEVRVWNASSQPFSVVHAPCALQSMGDMPTTISRGSSGTIDAAPPAPWVHRMTACLEAVAACGTHVVGVIDAPSDLHIRAAIEGMTGLQALFAAISGDDTKFLILTGAPKPQYTTVSDGHKSCTYTDKPWRHLISRGAWDWTVQTPDPSGLNRMETALARLLGTCEPSTLRRQVHLEYPEGATVPACTAQYIKYGPRVDTASVRFSGSRGITVHATGPGDITATVIAATEPKDGDPPEEEVMAQLRTMLTSADIAKIGSAYFTLGQMQLDEPMASIAAAAMRNAGHKYCSVSIAPPPPVLRQASFNSGHTAWH